MVQTAHYEALHDADAYAELGRIEQDPRKRIEALARASELGSEDAYLYLDYARALLESPEPSIELVRTALHRAAELRPGLADAHLFLAALAERSGDSAEETLHLRKAEGLDPVFDYARRLRLAQVLFETGSDLQAKVALAQASRHVRTADQMRALERTGGAERSDPLEAVDDLLEQGKADDAIGLLIELQKKYPGAAPVYENLAAAQDARGVPEQAERFRRDARMHQLAGAFEAGRSKREILACVSLLDAAALYDASDRYFGALEAANPADWGARNDRAYGLAESDLRPAEAIRLAEAALARAPDANRATVEDTLGWAYVKAGRLDDAIRLLERLAIENRGSPVYAFHYGVALASAGRGAEAVEQFNRALKNKNLSARFRAKLEKARTEAAE